MESTHLSFSAVAKYNRCPRQYWFHYRSDVAADESESDTAPRDIGSAAHDAFEHALRAVGSGIAPIRAARSRVQYFIDSEAYPTAVISTVQDIVTAYIPELGLGTTLKPLILPNGEPAVEWGFDVPMQSGITFKGKVDAVCTTEGGKVVLIDWKFRKYLADDHDVALDPQLYLYADVFQRVTGIHIDAAYQVQMSTVTPAAPTLNLDGETVSKITRKTTESIARRTLERLPLTEEQVQLGMERLQGKIMPITHFVRISPVDLKYTATAVADFQDATSTILEDRYYRRTPSVMTCKWCPFKGLCLDT